MGLRLRSSPTRPYLPFRPRAGGRAGDPTFVRCPYTTRRRGAGRERGIGTHRGGRGENSGRSAIARTVSRTPLGPIAGRTLPAVSTRRTWTPAAVHNRVGATGRSTPCQAPGISKRGAGRPRNNSGYGTVRGSFDLPIGTACSAPLRPLSPRQRARPVRWACRATGYKNFAAVASVDRTRGVF